MPPVSDDEDYYLPLEDQRVFGAGIKRKGVAFVPSNESNNAVSSTTSPSSRSTTIANRYLSIVLPETEKSVQVAHDREKHQSSDSTTADAGAPATSTPPPQICPVCNLPLILPVPSSTSHETSIAHQVSMVHSHPPSHLDRNNIGLKYLTSHGWDPDSRQGLGVGGAGIRIPVKAKEKNDTIGIGIDSSKHGRQLAAPAITKRLNAKQVRRLEEEDKKRREKLQRMFYQNDDVAKYLGEDG